MEYQKNEWKSYDKTKPKELQPNAIIARHKLEAVENGIMDLVKEVTELRQLINSGGSGGDTGGGGTNDELLNEIADARVDIDAISHPNIGVAIRSQINKLKSDKADKISYENGSLLLKSGETTIGTPVTLDSSTIGALPATTNIPSKISELQNDSNYITDIILQGKNFVDEDTLTSKNFASSSSVNQLTESLEGVNTSMVVADTKITANTHLINRLFHLYSDGSLLTDCLNINTADPIDDYNTKHWCVWDGGASPTGHMPPGCELGFRSYEYFNPNWHCIKILEMHPVMGREWTNRYDVAQDLWVGWETVGKFKGDVVQKTNKIWYNGKPIYRQVVDFGAIGSSSNYKDTHLITIPNIDAFFICQESFFTDSNGNKCQIGSVASMALSDLNTVWYSPSNGYIYLRNATHAIQSGFLTIEYTLTTD